MHEEIFAEFAVAGGARVLGMDLKPFSLWHWLLLQKTRNPIVEKSVAEFSELPEEIQRQKLFAAGQICSRYRHELSLKIRWTRWRVWRARKLDTANEVEKFQLYRLHGSSDFPTVKQPRVSGAPYHYFGAPELARLLLFAEQNHLAELAGAPSAHDVPVAFARMMYSAKLEADGALWIQNEQDAETQRARAEGEKKGVTGQFAFGEDAVQSAAEKWNREHPECLVPLMRPPNN